MFGSNVLMPGYLYVQEKVGNGGTHFSCDRCTFIHYSLQNVQITDTQGDYFQCLKHKMHRCDKMPALAFIGHYWGVCIDVVQKVVLLFMVV